MGHAVCHRPRRRPAGPHGTGRRRRLPDVLRLQRPGSPRPLEWHGHPPGRHHAACCPTRKFAASSAAATTSARSSRRLQRAVQSNGRPTAILIKTIKGYGMQGYEGSNVVHQKKNLNVEERQETARRLGIPLSDEATARADFYRPADGQRGTPLPDGAPDARWAATGRSRTVDCPSLAGAGSGALPGTARRFRRPAPLHHHGLRPHAVQTAGPSRTWADTSSRSCRTKPAPSAWKPCFARPASTPPKARSTGRSTAPR